MLYPIKVIDVELSRPIQTIKGLEGYMGLQGLVRLHGVPIGYVKAPITNGYCSAQTLSKLILEEHSWKIIHELIKNGLASPQRPEEFTIENLLDVPPPPCPEPLPLVTVAVCTRDRTDDLARCLDAIVQLDYPHLDLLVVDNAPSDDATQQLVQTQYPQVRYVREPRPGLDWARNRANIEAYGEIIAYTDDDVVVDRGWVKALAKVFAENPEVMAVTGLIVPYELETEAQILFEMKDGFGKGFERKWYRVCQGDKMPWWLVAAVGLGTGANMAYRRCVFDQIDGFDPALDVGTVTNGAGDLEMFFRVIKEGYTLVYEPSAMVWHRHRRDYQKLRTQLTNNGSVYSYFVRTAMAYPDERLCVLRLGLSWIWSWHLRRLINSLMSPSRFPRDLIWAEMWGCLIGLTRYQKACKIANEIAETHGSQPLPVVPAKPIVLKSAPKIPGAVAVRTVEASQPLSALTDVTDYTSVRIFVTWKGIPLGSVDIYNDCQIVSVERLVEAIVASVGLGLLEAEFGHNKDIRWAEAIASLKQRLQHSKDSEKPATLPTDVPVSIVVGSYDRPDNLRNCLRCLTSQKSLRKVEIIVVDNHPDSGLTPPVVSEFPSVKLVSEPRQGVAYARNAGFVQAKGEIIATVDDDVTVPSDWLEKLIAPFTRNDVMVVTGNVLPLELETSSQCLFEQYGDGGLNRGFNRFEANSDWFERSPSRYVVPVWLLGGTANAAFRSTIFSHPEIGLMDEALGPGMPSGVGEDIYIFYKVLKSGYTIVYEPKAFLWHTHRRTMPALRRQLYNYSKGIVSYHLTTLLRDRDFRVIPNMLIDMPGWHVRRIKERLEHRSTHPIPLILVEIAGNLAGFWSLWLSHQRVKRLGRSTPYIPVHQRPTVSEALLQEVSSSDVIHSTVANSLQEI
ncbi:glycosyl transferase family 2 [filamentous cyanobacterium CCP2]|nr:glycosyl transferase family 2 [filamentous cyanobacterium CCP2]